MTIEDVAIQYVIERERLQGRAAKDMRGRSAADVESDGRIIEVKAFSASWRSGVLYFTPPQLREGGQNENYWVYVVDNIAQGDPSKFDLTKLHGEDLRRLFAAAKPHRSSIAVRAADKARFKRLSDLGHLHPADGAAPATQTGQPMSRATRGRGRPKPILDTETGKEYGSEYGAGKALYSLVGGDIKDTFVWFKILRAFPRRFRTKNAEGEWVPTDDPSAPRGSTLPDS